MKKVSTDKPQQETLLTHRWEPCQADNIATSDLLETIKEPAAKLKKVSSNKGSHKQTKKAKVPEMKKASTDKPQQETLPVCPWKGYAFVPADREDESTAKNRFLEPVTGKRMPKPKCLLDI